MLSSAHADAHGSWIARFMNSTLPPVLIVLALLAGTIALLLTPREEDPQIVVPMADILVSAPGLSARQIENQVTSPLEKLLHQIDGVEYVYSTTVTGSTTITLRFRVGEDREDSLLKLYNKLYSNQDQIPAIVDNWIVKPIEIDDVPIVVAALYSTRPDEVGAYELRRIAEEAVDTLQAIETTNQVSVVGGMPRKILIELDGPALTSRMTTVQDIEWALKVSNHRQAVGQLIQPGEVTELQSGSLLGSVAELESLVVNVVSGQPVHLGDIARIRDGPEDLRHVTGFRYGPAAELPDSQAQMYPAVYLAVAKQKGSNAVWVANDVLETLSRLKAEQFPTGVEFRVIRNYGETANQKVGNLVSSLGIAILTVIVFIGLFLNWRAALVVGIAIPISYGAALGMDLAFGYTINRVTLFALILALGLIVDDPIASIDNIERFLRRADLPRSEAIVLAMNEIRGALLMSTLAIVIVFIPMFFITGMMGPYMGPLAFNVPVSVMFSTCVAFLVTPWLAKRLLKSPTDLQPVRTQDSALYRIYRTGLSPLLQSRRRSWLFIGLIGVLFAGAALLPALRMVPLKLLPYDNKNEFQVVVDLPESATLEDTSRVLAELSDYLVRVPEVESIGSFSGIASPMDFNGMVRHDFMRNGSHQGELRVMLAKQHQRRSQSHELVTRLRKDLEQIGKTHSALIRLVEMPPGPPVIATVVAEIYGQPDTPYAELENAADVLAQRMRAEPFLTEVDSSRPDAQPLHRFVIDREKAALSGIATTDINQTLHAASQGRVVSHLHIETENALLPIEIRMNEAQRNLPEQLTTLSVRGRPGIARQLRNGVLEDAPRPVVTLGELGEFVETESGHPIFHKNLRPVAYVYAESAGRPPADVVADLMADRNAKDEATLRPLETRTFLNNGGGNSWKVDEGIEVVWNGEGEWKLTLDVFRDLGIAYAVALLGVYIVMVIQTGLPAVSGMIMLAIPLTIIGIMPGFWFLNLVSVDEINGYPNPSLFTATAMIGMIALAGIVVRNSLVLIQFIHQALRAGAELPDALYQAGAVRMRPILLTAGTTVLGNIVITLDPIFNGLAWAIIFGITASTVFTLLVIPVVYHLAYANAPTHGLPQAAKES